MIVGISNIESELKHYKLSKKVVELIKSEIEKQLFLYKKLNIDPSNISLILLYRKPLNLEVIRVFDHNNILLENLDLSCERLKKISVFNKNNVDSIFWVSFFDGGNSISIVKSKMLDLNDLNYKKIKSITYGVTDGKDVIKINILQQDIKGADYEILKNAVKYKFEKEKGRSCENLNCVALNYS